jgi:hypothetical protein
MRCLLPAAMLQTFICRHENEVLLFFQNFADGLANGATGQLNV